MTWVTKLNETYDAIGRKDDSTLWPISHFFKTAHIEVVLDSHGNFKKNRARILDNDESDTLIPATEASAGRSGAKIAPHPLCEELSYCAGDIPAVDNREKRDVFMNQLMAWCASGYAHPKAKAILNYLEQNKLWKDLSSEIDFPISFRSKSGQKTSVEPRKTFIRWRVEEPGEPGGATWEDQGLINAWIKYDAECNRRDALCYATGIHERPAQNHPRFIRNKGDGAKIVSSNDSRGYTYRGRFTFPEQAASMSFTVSQRAHSALRWLIQNQGFKNSDQAIVAWAVSGKEIPKPLVETTKFDWDDFSEVEDAQTADSATAEIDHTIDIGQSFARKLSKYMAGYRAALSPTDTISIMAVDSATPGRMGITYYREYWPPEYLDQITKWHTEFAWFLRVIKEIPRQGGESKTVVDWTPCAPSPSTIVNSIYGAKSNNKKDPESFKALRRKFIERLIPSVIEGLPIPWDFVISAFHRARSPVSFDRTREWEKCLGVACSLYRGFHIRHPQASNRKEFPMSLDRSNTSRDYLYGRLLAIAERIEDVALWAADIERPTTASRLMQRFSDRPFATWPTIYKQLDPYMRQLKTSQKPALRGFLTNMEKEVDEVMNLFDADEFKSEKSLSGEFLLGFHAERLFLKSKSKARSEDATESNEE